MNIQITDKVSAVRVSEDGHTTFHVVEDRSVLMAVPHYSVLSETLSVVELYQQHYEVIKCLRKTSVRTTYEMLLNERNKLEARIDQLLATRN